MEQKNLINNHSQFGLSFNDSINTDQVKCTAYTISSVYLWRLQSWGLVVRMPTNIHESLIDAFENSIKIQLKVSEDTRALKEDRTFLSPPATRGKRTVRATFLTLPVSLYSGYSIHLDSAVEPVRLVFQPLYDAEVSIPAATSWIYRNLLWTLLLDDD